ncbi:MAG: hemolysin family protein [Lachnospiraceae bacterium]|nr:hemolysin family protein [Lachnospiraceae bacterium]
MDDGGPTASYLIFFALLFIDVFFYGFSAAVKELNSKELSDQLEESGNKKVRRLYQIAVSPQQHIDTVQLVVTLINLTAGSFVLDNFERLSHKLIAGIIVLYILLTFGVLIPKKLGARYAHKWAYACINPIYYVTKILSPFTGLVSLTTKGILRIFGISVNNDSEDVTEEEIISMVNEGHEQGVLLATEAEMITKIFQFGDKEAQDIMTHRKNILAIDRNMTLSDALDYMLSESKSRFPVYEENIDHVLGILHFRDAMRAHREPGNMSLAVGDIDGLIRETMYIPETKNIDDLFKDMQRTKTQMVIVVDEYGQTTGLLAMEDILEEIVGNIMDEYDEDEAYIEETENDDEYIIEGITPLEELEERFGISFNEEEFETLNGFLISKMDKIPEENEEFSIDVDGYSFRILSVENRMIKSVLVTKLPEKEPDGDVQQTEEDNTTNKQE